MRSSGFVAHNGGRKLIAGLELARAGKAIYLVGVTPKEERIPVVKLELGAFRRLCWKFVTPALLCGLAIFLSLAALLWWLRLTAPCLAAP